MRSLRIAALMTALGLPATASAEPVERPNTITTNPVRFALLHFALEYERALGGRTSLFVQPIAFHHATWYPFAHAPGMTANGYGLDFGSRHFLVGAAPAGAFLGPFFSAYRGETLRDGETELEGTVLSAGFQGGYTHTIGRWVLSGGGGVSYGYATEEAPDGADKAEQLPHRGVWLNFRANAGVAF